MYVTHIGMLSHTPTYNILSCRDVYMHRKIWKENKKDVDVLVKGQYRLNQKYASGRYSKFPIKNPVFYTVHNNCNVTSTRNKVRELRGKEDCKLVRTRENDKFTLLWEVSVIRIVIAISWG